MTSTGIGILILSLVQGTRYIRSRGIIHRDLKPSNILINGNEYVWISDFGASLSASVDATSEKGTGTIRYEAPEQFEERSVCTTKCDVFVFGLVSAKSLLVGQCFRRQNRISVSLVGFIAETSQFFPTGTEI
jgi:serine/threonine protein kinase